MMQNTSKKVRWGIVGAGRIANTFAKDIAYAPSACLQAVASRQLDSARSFAQQFDIPQAYASYAELFNDPKVDAVYIATPHSHHKDQSIAALRAGKHVLCEKPATVTPHELEQVLAVAQEQKRYFMEGMWTYFFPVIQQAKQWVDGGKIGHLCHVKADFGFPLPYSPDLREYDHRLGGGCLLEMGIYPVAMAWLFLKQYPTGQFVWHHKADNGVEDDVVVVNRYGKDVATAQLTTSFRSKLNNYLTLVGDRGTITISDYWCAREAKLYKGIDCVDRFSEDRECQGFHHQIERVSRELIGGKLQPEVVTWEDSRAFQKQMAEIKTHF